MNTFIFTDAHFPLPLPSFLAFSVARCAANGKHVLSAILTAVSWVLATVFLYCYYYFFFFDYKINHLFDIDEGKTTYTFNHVYCITTDIVIDVNACYYVYTPFPSAMKNIFFLLVWVIEVQSESNYCY